MKKIKLNKKNNAFARKILMDKTNYIPIKEALAEAEKKLVGKKQKKK